MYAKSELDHLKQQVNLIEYAATQGYELDTRESSPSCKLMRNRVNDDKIIVGISAASGHWQYFSARDGQDRGTIVDFIQCRNKQMSFLEVLNELRAWAGSGHRVNVPSAHRSVQPIQRDRAAVALAVAAAETVRTSPYLNSRGIRPEVLNGDRFRGTWKQDKRGNVLFPHHDATGLAGYELKNHRYTRFAKGGEKALWHSNAASEDQRLVIAEAAIDALSYHQLHPDRQARYISIGGCPNPKQPDLISRAIAKMPQGGSVIAATDNDKAGTQLAEQIALIASKHPHVTCVRHSPAQEKDWNDILRHKERAYIQEIAAARKRPQVEVSF